MKISYKFRLICLIVLFVDILSAAITMIANKYIKASATQAFAERGISTIYKTKAFIDEVEFNELVKGGTKNTEYYNILHTQMCELKKSQSCKFLYTMVPVEGSKFMYIVDGSAQYSDDFSDYGVVEDISSYGKYPKMCLDTQEIVVSDIRYQDMWGWMVSIYAPIIFEGESIGFIACEYDVASLIENIKTYRNNMILVACVITIVGALFIVFYIALFFNRLNAVTKAMNNISSGARDLTQRLLVKGENELDNLSNAYNKVISQLQEMMKSIKSSVKQLSENSNVLLSQNNENFTLIENAKTSIEEIYQKADDQNVLSTQVSTGIAGVETAVKILDEKIIQQSEAVEKSSSAVEQINTSINSANETISRISNEYEKIV